MCEAPEDKYAGATVWQKSTARRRIAKIKDLKMEKKTFMLVQKQFLLI